MKLNRFRTQEFSFNFEAGQPTNIKASIMTFIADLENNGYVLFDISDGQVAADKITLTSA